MASSKEGFIFRLYFFFMVLAPQHSPFSDSLSLKRGVGTRGLWPFLACSCDGYTPRTMLQDRGHIK